MKFFGLDLPEGSFFGLMVKTLPDEVKISNFWFEKILCVSTISFWLDFIFSKSKWSLNVFNNPSLVIATVILTISSNSSKFMSS